MACKEADLQRRVTDTVVNGSTGPAEIGKKLTTAELLSLFGV